MGRTFKLKKDYYDEGVNIFKKSEIEIEDGLTVLVGCNGAGKTTLLKQIKAQLDANEIPVLYHSNLTDGVGTMREKALLNSNIDFLALSIISSEGENIVNCMSEVARQMGTLSQNNPNAEELWFLMDAIDSGLSVDNIVELKQELINFVIEMENKIGRKAYFVISANEYEFARNEACFDVIGGEYITFDTYDDYRKYILQSKERKSKQGR